MIEGNHDAGHSGRIPAPAAADAFELEADRQRVARVERLYRAKSGPLLAWLREERLSRGDTPEQFCAKLGATRAYLGDLWQTPEKMQGISAEFARRCAAYLGVPPIVVKVLAGQVALVDFIAPSESEETVVDRALRRMAADSVARQVLPANPTALQMEAKRALVRMYGEFLGEDLIGARWLPGMLEWLEPAAQIHFAHATKAKLMAISHGQFEHRAPGEAQENK